jgi:prefoldin subunit 5
MYDYTDYSNEELIKLLKYRDEHIDSLRNAIGNLKDMLRERNTELHELERAKGVSNTMLKAVLHNAVR